MCGRDPLIDVTSTHFACMIFATTARRRKLEYAALRAAPRRASRLTAGQPFGNSVQLKPTRRAFMTVVSTRSVIADCASGLAT